MPCDNPYPVYDHTQKKWTAEWSGGMRKPDLWFSSQEEAQGWCDKMIAAWEK